MEDIEIISTQIDGDITYIKSDFYGKKLAVGSSLGKIIIFENINNKYQKISELEAHCGPILGLTWSYPKYGPLLCSCGFDKKINLYVLNAKNQINKIYENEDLDNSVVCVSFLKSSYTLLLIAGDLNGDLLILKYNGSGFSSKKVFGHDFGVNAVKFLDGRSFVSAGCDKKIKIWAFNESLESVKETLSFPDIDSVTQDLSVKDESCFAAVTDDGSVYLFKKQKDENNWDKNIIYKAECPLEKIEFSEEGNALCIIDETGAENILNEEQMNSRL